MACEGHCILLIEDSVEGPRTFSEYPSLYDLQIALIRMYEEYRESVGIGSDLKNFHNWLDGFSRMDAFIYDTKFGRYKQMGCEKLRMEFEEANDVPQVKNDHLRMPTSDSEDEDWDK